MQKELIKGHTIHVNAHGEERGDGTEQHPFTTIQAAADVALPGDTVLVHAGIYREHVQPVHSGLSPAARITYTAAPGERVIIKGSIIVDSWKPERDNVWVAKISNTVFDGFNPFAESLHGDWLERPDDWTLSLGSVYINGFMLYQARTINDVFKPTIRTTGFGPDWVRETEPILSPEDTVLCWYAEVDKNITTIWANFGQADPTQALIEINARSSCFSPTLYGINYITVRGFEMSQCATQWAPPTGPQQGVIAPNWSKGWIIENNDIHHSRCVGVSLGKKVFECDNNATRFHHKPGYQEQLEVVFKARHDGWDKETVGSHIVRNNHIHDCGQAGVVGHLGCINSAIYSNEIHHIGERHEFFGHEIAGVKLHAAIDVTIRNNYFHHCTLGTWLDWEAQGTRVSSNIYSNNIRDLMIEVTSGPCLVDNNIFASAYNFDNVAQGTALVHNLFCGSTQRRTVPNRSTPYHFPHSTQIAGYACIYGSDDRLFQNIFIGGKDYLPGISSRGTETYSDAPASEAEYIQKVTSQGIGDLELFEAISQPAYVQGNAYLNSAQHSTKETEFFTSSRDPQVHIEDNGDEVMLVISLPTGFNSINTEVINTEKLGFPRIVRQPYENPDGSSLLIDKDLLDKNRDEKPTVGPLEELHEGSNCICIWRR